MKIQVEISPGELLDKLSILEIKLYMIDEADKIKNIQYEKDILYDISKTLDLNCVNKLVDQLVAVNLDLWLVEDELRLLEAAEAFDKHFIKLARSVYMKNDLRARIKKDINILLGSNIVEEKSYTKY